MANHKSARKRAKQAIVKKEQNKAKYSKVRTLVKKFRDAITSKNKELATTLFPTVQSGLAKLGQSKVVKLNTASRKISRLAEQLSKI